MLEFNGVLGFEMRIFVLLPLLIVLGGCAKEKDNSPICPICDERATMQMHPRMSGTGIKSYYKCDNKHDFNAYGVLVDVFGEPLKKKPAVKKDKTEGDLSYSIKDEAVTITKCNSSASGELSIPVTIEGKPVTSIGESAFYECRNLTSITIPESVTSIGDKAFFRCKNLSSIAIPDSCVIGKGAFAQCSKLITIVLNAGNTNYTVVNGILYNKEKTQLHAYLAGNTRKEYTIPDSVTNITAYAFSGCLNLTSITIPDSVTSIGADVFSKCRSLTNIRIPNGVTSIGNNAFYLCTSLTRLTIPDGVTSIGERAFNQCRSLSSITIPDGVTSIGINAFWNCSSLTSITIGAGVTSIENSAFSQCTSLTAVTFLGDAPKEGKAIFIGVNPTIYRKPEAKGWGETFAGRPVKLISEKP